MLPCHVYNSWHHVLYSITISLGLVAITCWGDFAGGTHPCRINFCLTTSLYDISIETISIIKYNIRNTAAAAARLSWTNISVGQTVSAINVNQASAQSIPITTWCLFSIFSNFSRIPAMLYKARHVIRSITNDSNHPRIDIASTSLTPSFAGNAPSIWRDNKRDERRKKKEERREHLLPLVKSFHGHV